MDGMTSMKMTAKEAKEYASPSTAVADAPQFPYGLRVELNNDSLDKLAMKDMPKIGDRFTMTCTVEACGCASYTERDGDENRSLSLQITDMALVPMAAKKSAADAIYPTKS